ncbi:hypothetical protein O6R08_00375 [Cutibacterium equinum]|uniref:Uncharacterized protein n=1 Tax=Cutibacterium equinum TaxID=3016342 RepID=A0ABY7QYF3_9ACTN|nr:hypothetical protein [Cutibacterium equinum]WCC80062.1 hypothetical protein O6R08_00375 [Cutibacterium equinum]
MTPPDPWAELRTMPHIDLVWGGLPAGWRGATDGRPSGCQPASHSGDDVRRWPTSGPTFGWGLLTAQPPACEERVKVATARWLLPDLTAMSDAISDSTPENAALSRWVTDDILTTRLARIIAGERDHMSRIAAA